LVEYALLTGGSFLTTLLNSMKPGLSTVSIFCSKFGISLSSNEALVAVLALVVLVFASLFFATKKM
jgi:hypothetical protein